MDRQAVSVLHHALLLSVLGSSSRRTSC
jgi:hypothetical protein